MANGNREARSLLKDVMLHGTATIDKRKLLWLIGWAQDRPGAWADLLTIWEDIGGNRKALIGVEVDSSIVLMRSSLKDVALVTTWAGN